jgi:hypothetical protein
VSRHRSHAGAKEADDFMTDIGVIEALALGANPDKFGK